MATVSLAAGLLLPWLVGIAALLAAPRRLHSLDLPGEIAWLFGASYFVGAFLLTVWMRALSAAGIEFGWGAVGAPIFLAATALGYLGWRRNGAVFTSALSVAVPALLGPPALSPSARLVWRLLLAWMALRFALLGLEVMWRPLYPWDAWIQWATKARVWHELGRIVPFAPADVWLADGDAPYFDASPDNPATMPLLQVWSCIALGRWDDTLMNWPWWQIASALTLAVYGALRSLGIPDLGALVGSFLVASLPLANVHVALAGYADLPMAAYYTVTVLAFLRWAEARSSRDGGLALLLALACPQVAAPGLLWASTLVPGLIVACLPRHGLRMAAIGAGISVFLLVVLARTNLQLAGHVLHLEFDPAWSAVGQSYFLLANWHLLWFGAIAAALLAWRQLVAPPLAPLTAVVAFAVLFLFIVFGFPDVHVWVGSQTTVNRATLHLAPLLVVFLVLAFRAYSQSWRATHPDVALKP